MRFEDTIPGLREGKRYIRQEKEGPVHLSMKSGHMSVYAWHRGEYQHDVNQPTLEDLESEAWMEEESWRRNLYEE